MNPALVATLVLATLCCVSAFDMDAAKDKQCMDKHGVTDDDIKAAKETATPTEKITCMMGCLGEKHEANYEEFIDKSKKLGEENKAVLKDCVGKLKVTGDDCALGKQLLACLGKIMAKN